MASLAVGLTVSAILWTVIDRLLHRTGIMVLEFFQLLTNLWEVPVCRTHVQ